MRFDERDKNFIRNSIGALEMTAVTESELKFLEYFGTNYKILDGNLKPLLALKEANISSHYRNYNLRDKELPHVTVCISEGTHGYRVRLDLLELGKEDPRITWLW